MGDGNKVEFLVAICALLTSAMAVFMAWDQGRVMRAQQHGAVFPVLQVDGYAINTEAKAAVGIRIRNSGVGPALIESVTLLIDGEVTPGFGDYTETLADGYELSWTSLTGRALAPGESVVPVEIFWPIDEFDRDMIRQVSADAESWALEICYCSVFQKCWQTREIGRSLAKPISQCTRGEVDIFEQLGAQELAASNDIKPTKENKP